MVVEGKAAVMQVTAAFLILIDDVHRVLYTQDGDWLRKFRDSDPGPNSIWLSPGERRQAENTGLLIPMLWSVIPAEMLN